MSLPSWTFEEIIEALRPFAETAHMLVEEGLICAPDCPIEEAMEAHQYLTVGDLRRARDIFLKLGGKLDE